MAAVVQLNSDWSSTDLTLNVPLTVNHVRRILLHHNGRHVECATERISYRPGVTTFTVHKFEDDDGPFYIFAFAHGWAIHERDVMALIEVGVICSGIEIT